MRPAPFILILLNLCIFNSQALPNRIYCEGRWTEILGDKNNSSTFSGVYVLDIFQNEPSYISVEGKLFTPDEEYTIQRTLHVQAKLVNKEDSIYDITPIKTIIYSEDNLSKSSENNLLLSKPRIYRIRKTLNRSYLISTPASPVFICHEIK